MASPSSPEASPAPAAKSSQRWADMADDDDLPPLASLSLGGGAQASTTADTKPAAAAPTPTTAPAPAPATTASTSTPTAVAPATASSSSSTTTSTSTSTAEPAAEGSTGKPEHRHLGPAQIDLEILEAEITVRSSDPHSPLFSVKSFQELNLPPKLLQGVIDMGFKKPSSIQERALPLILGGSPQNVIGQAQSGTGKTAAFSLGMLGLVNPELHYPQALCLAPARELAIQICDVVKRLARFTDIDIALAVPQAPLPDIIKSQVIIGTPGVVKSLCSKKGGKAAKINLSRLRIFVLDEADNMVVSFQQFCKDMKAKCSKQTLFLCFSATFNDEVQRFMEDFVPEPRAELIVKKKTEWSVDQIRQYYVECEQIGKYNTLKTLYEYISVGSCILFVETRRDASDITRRLKAENFTVDVLHSDLEPHERDQVMERFRSNQFRILLATNVLSRGIDVSQVSMVINYDLPHRDGVADVETYLHRIGRTGRFGRPGVAVSFVHDPVSRKVLKEIETQLGRPIASIDGTNLDRISDELNELFTK